MSELVAERVEPYSFTEEQLRWLREHPNRWPVRYVSREELERLGALLPTPWTVVVDEVVDE